MNKSNTHIIKKAAALLTGCFFMLACENDVNTVKDLGKRLPGIDEGRNIEIYMSQDGKMKAKLISPLMLKYQADSGRRAEFPNTLHVDFFDSTLKVESQLFAKYGRYVENDNKIFLRDSVVTFNIKGDTMFCKELYWDQVLGRFYTEKEVTIIQKSIGQKLISKNGMNCNQNLSDLHLYKIQPGSFFIIPDSSTVQY